MKAKNLCGIYFTTFKADICQLILPTLCPTFEMSDDSLQLMLEKQAPLHSCRVPIDKNDPWHNAMKSDIIATKNRHLGTKTVLKNQCILNRQQFSKAKKVYGKNNA